ncbi:amino acid ABC transporter substrate-binding protein, PAAT family (TC 3.A.1.3.-) [Pseudomonas sp. LAMO17WK12:I10]|jgi:polar amino acid transport system substrate-binding protein|uniref:ABC transporter substrate-binding protein n=1 Tax=unclassified Pseudomonas TaxID=196821 RepID=UPI000BDCFF39|nr:MULTISPECIES: ABC transporter substrate-binding protein [unclassified Pseudomonas]PXX55514.1 polar amino acid transport system substrate-binding protein [Pseudomonas sp. LAMO17WK12:I9]SNY51091.1 amino acid ABC transporter substrate-binding protein, PAAT family (TC 3.A.1.3.-) [Pseudomonas sp. LAMO17WK12:I10]
MHKPCASAAVFTLSLCCSLWAQAAPELPERLSKSEKIVYCSGMDSPPLVSFDTQQKPVGLQVDMGEAIAQRLGGKQVEWRISPFAGLIPALLAQQCDMIVDQLFDKPERREVIDIVNFMYSSQSIVVPKGNPKAVNSLEDLSGLKVAVSNGSTIRILLGAENDKLLAAGKPPMKLVVYNVDADAFQALRINQVDAFGTTVESAGHYQQLAPDLFQSAVPAFNRILTGFGVRKQDPQLSAALSQVLQDMRTDGSYAALLDKWHVGSDKLD